MLCSKVKRPFEDMHRLLWRLFLGFLPPSRSGSQQVEAPIMVFLLVGFDEQQELTSMPVLVTRPTAKVLHPGWLLLAIAFGGGTPSEKREPDDGAKQAVFGGQIREETKKRSQFFFALRPRRFGL